MASGSGCFTAESRREVSIGHARVAKGHLVPENQPVSSELPPSRRPALTRASIALVGLLLPVPFVHFLTAEQIALVAGGGVGLGVALTLLGNVGRRMTVAPAGLTGAVAAALGAGSVALSGLVGQLTLVLLASASWGIAVLAGIAAVRWGNKQSPGISDWKDGGRT